MKNKSVILGFSGGLDTTYCVKYLSDELGYEVHTLTVNTGGFSVDELKAIEEHALSLGVTSHKSIDATESYYTRIIKYLVFGNVLKNNTYPLSVSAERLSQAIALANYANELKVNTVAHGSTGAGNDQVRFDMILELLINRVEILTAIRDLKLSRAEEVDYLKSKGVKMNYEKMPYSINKGLWGTSIGGKETLNSKGMFDDSVWPSQPTETTEEALVLQFEKGELVGINNQSYTPVKAIQKLQGISEKYAIGRDVHVGDTIIGIKGRVAFEAGAPLLIIKAHHALEKHVLTKWQLNWKDQLALFYGNHLHEGQILDPVMRDIEAFFERSQDKVSGKVFIKLMPYRFLIEGVESPYDLMNTNFGAYGEMNKTWTGEDVRGFTKIVGNQVAIYHKVNNIQYGND